MGNAELLSRFEKGSKNMCWFRMMDLALCTGWLLGEGPEAENWFRHGSSFNQARSRSQLKKQPSSQDRELCVVVRPGRGKVEAQTLSFKSTIKRRV